MRKRLSTAVAASLVLMSATGAGAAESKDKEKAPPPFLALQPIGFPAIVKGELVNYIFVSVKLMLKPGQDPVKLHEQEPYLRDILVRQGTRVPFNPPADPMHLDDARLKAAILTASRSTLGPNAVLSVEFVSETPEHRIAMPKPAGAH